MKIHAAVSAAIAAVISVDQAAGAAVLALALKCVETGTKPEALETHKGLTASRSWKSYRSAIRRVIAGKADGDAKATEIMAYAYGSSTTKGKAAKASAKGKATATKAAAPKGNPLKGVPASQVLSWLAEAGTAKEVYTLLNSMVK